MTTLPQTTGVRFPRAGARTPSIPALAQPHAGAAAGGASSGMTAADVLRVLRANLLLIVICTILGAALGYAINQYVLDRYMKRYTASAVLEVHPPTGGDLFSGGGGGIADQRMLEIRQKTLAQKLLSPELWRPMLMNVSDPVRKTAFVQSFAKPDGSIDPAIVLESLQEKLSVTPNPSTELISVSLAAPTAEDAQTLLVGIVNRLLVTEQKANGNATDEERTSYQQLAQRLQTQIDGLTTQINDLSSRLNIPRDGNQSNGIAMVNTVEIQALTTQKIKLQSDYAQAMGDYQAYAQAYDAGLYPSLLSRIAEQNQSLLRAEMMVDEAKVNLETIKAIYAPDHRNVKSAQANYDAAKAALEEKREQFRIGTGASMKDSLLTAAKSVEDDLKQTVAQITEAERRIGELNKETASYNTALDLRKYLIDKKDKVDSRLLVLSASTNYANDSRGSVRLWSPIDKPDRQSFPNLKMSIGIASLLGLGLALGIAFLREVMDTSVRSPRDITRVGQLNLLGMIPHTDDDPQAAAGELSLAISQSPNSIIAENFRQVRTRLQHAASLDTTRSLLVTSPGPADGKTTVACNIAAGLALNGRKILLVDANFRRPELHRVFGVANDSGFGSVLSGAASVEQVAKHTQVPNLDVLTTGPRPANPTELLESQLLTDFIDGALEEYDHVIFDAGPILLVSETVALAPRVDGVVTVVRAKANSRGLLQRMRDALRQLKAEHLGVVLNGVRQHTGGYYRRNIKNYYAYQNANG